jgi:hypothetical protein
MAWGRDGQRTVVGNKTSELFWYVKKTSEPSYVKKTPSYVKKTVQPACLRFTWLHVVRE